MTAFRRSEIHPCGGRRPPQAAGQPFLADHGSGPWSITKTGGHVEVRFDAATQSIRHARRLTFFCQRC